MLKVYDDKNCSNKCVILTCVAGMQDECVRLSFQKTQRVTSGRKCQVTNMLVPHPVCMHVCMGFNQHSSRAVVD